MTISKLFQHSLSMACVVVCGLHGTMPAVAAEKVQGHPAIPSKRIVLSEHDRQSLTFLSAAIFQSSSKNENPHDGEIYRVHLSGLFLQTYDSYFIYPGYYPQRQHFPIGYRWPLEFLIPTEIALMYFEFMTYWKLRQF